jgi:cyclopropane-fatty-acyl-phospholipid synthase
MERDFNRLVRMLEKTYEEFSAPDMAIPFGLQIIGRAPHIFGLGEPAFTVIVKGKNGITALSTLDATTIVEAYMAGDLDIQGDLMQVYVLRDMFTDNHLFRHLWRFAQPLLFGQISSDKNWIAQHYDYDSEFYLLFLDNKHRCYSQGVFVDDSEPLESAMTRKLEYAIASIGVKPGQQVLDIGTGWGAFVEYAGHKEIQVTSLTISKESEKFVNNLIARDKLPCKVIRQHLLEYNPNKQYDAIVNLGVTEHLPDYRATLAKYQQLLKPGGRVYLDASASRTKHQIHSFVYRYIFPGNGSVLCLHDYLAELSNTPFRLNVVYNDRNSYYLTAKHWAQNLERNREEVIRRWGEPHYRKFQVYLWGCADGFLRDRLQAYRIVLELA